MSKTISGFSKLSKNKKIDWIVSTYFPDSNEAKNIIKQYWSSDEKLQKLHDEFIENTITNYYLPFGVAPNFLINGHPYTIPMAIEESSVVAAASKAAKFWLERGGFKAEVISTKKIGQVHIIYRGSSEALFSFFEELKPKILDETKPLTKNMEKRGGGILSVKLIDKTSELENYYQIHAEFDTRDAMGANFINSCLESFANTLRREAKTFKQFEDETIYPKVVMSILSNYVPECLVRAEVSCNIDLLQEGDISGQEFCERFVQAIKIAEVEPYRAVTHNKGIMNGIDAVVLATGNDFRAIEAGVHAYASKSGQYRSLTHAIVDNNIFKFWIEVPLALGTIGGLTSLHPLVKLSLEMLHRPNAEELMEIVAVAGLAQNFAAIKSLVTTGIQKGHMKMHLMNILNQFGANEEEKSILIPKFQDIHVSHSAVSEALNKMRE
ncbi:hydroxymethylglutaryl-CoA reductase, degradative [Aegicerativicinus sediminis]|uniref:hydroxymethylglutaryl-CoA reductase, degradative n=1 Tax=Aegicerativicinus sediminis TaxID=2893202 RepID=UPI001E33049D|nr:hydroxymethylglutaryl-CoA reductase, degradative [Aegicerativicinus sediminis]